MPGDAAQIAEDLEKLIKRDICPYGSTRLDARGELLDELNDLNKDPKRLNKVLDELHKVKDIEVKEHRDQTGNVVSIDFSDPYGATMDDCRRRLRPKDRRYAQQAEFFKEMLPLHDRIDVLSPKEQKTMTSIVDAIEKGNKPDLEKLLKGFTGNYDGFSRILPHVNSELYQHNSWLSITANYSEQSFVSVYDSRTQKNYSVKF